MVAYIKRLAVAEERWLSEEDFRRGLALSQALPGATAMQCAAFVGLRTRRLGGAVAAYVGFGLPAFFLMLGLSVAYSQAAGLATVASRLPGLRGLAVALVAFASWEFGRSSLAGLAGALIAGVSAAVFLLGGNPILTIAGAGLLGSIILRGPTAPPPSGGFRVIGWKAIRPAILVLAVAAGLASTLLLLPTRLGTLGLLMMKVDLFAFGGGLASVPLLLREVVDIRGWMTVNAFMDGIALGQVTPGPVVITATFVGFQVAGIPGALLGTVCIFLPSLFMIILAEPWFLRLQSSAICQAATRGLTLSFVGLLVSVAVQFARAASWSLPSVLIAALALAALLAKVNVVWVVLGGAAASAVFL